MKTATCVCACTMTLMAAGVSRANEQAFDRTPVGEIQIMDLPAAKVLATSVDGEYFGNANRLFMKLFDYIRKNDVAMTVPVEAQMKPGTMKFFVGAEDAARELASGGDVTVLNVPARTVASIGGRGAYSRRHFEGAKTKLEKWLDSSSQFTAAGDAYAVYWHGPYVPWFRKRYDVHIPVERKPSP